MACDADRDEPCRRPEGDNDGEKHTASPYGLKIEAFALYGERSLRLGECDRVDGGNIGVRSLADQMHDAQLRIGTHGYIDPERLVVAPSVAIGEGVTLGLVATNRFRDDRVSLRAPASFSAAEMPPLLLTFGGGTGPDVIVGRDHALALQPGQYGTIVVDGILLLNPGRYRAAKVSVGERGADRSDHWRRPTRHR